MKMREPIRIRVRDAVWKCGNDSVDSKIHMNLRRCHRPLYCVERAANALLEEVMDDQPFTD